MLTERPRRSEPRGVNELQIQPMSTAKRLRQNLRQQPGRNLLEENDREPDTPRRPWIRQPDKRHPPLTMHQPSIQMTPANTNAE